MTEEQIKAVLAQQQHVLGLRSIDLARKIDPTLGASGVPTCYSQVRKFLARPGACGLSTFIKYSSFLELEVIVRPRRPHKRG
jgi:hypothetical protein